MGENIPLGFSLCVFAGFCNGSWQLPLKASCPIWIRILDMKDDRDWKWENVWILYGSSSIVFTICYTYIVIEAKILNECFVNTDTLTIIMISIFSFLWGIGSFLFGLAVKFLGMAVGTSLLLGVVLVLGTLLPLLKDHLDRSDTLPFWLILLGVLFGTIGFAFSAVSGSVDVARQHQSDVTLNQDTCCEVGTLTSQRSLTSQKGDVDCANDSEEDAILTKEEPNMKSFSISSDSEACVTEIEDSPPLTRIHILKQISMTASQRAIVVRKRAKEYKGVLLALLGGVLATMLQFAFVFGSSLVREAEDRGISSQNAAQPVWLLAFSIGGILSVLYPAYLLYTKGTWRAYFHDQYLEERSNNSEEVPQIAKVVPSSDSVGGKRYSTSFWLNFIKRCVLSGLMAATWMAHIIIYGYAQSLMGELGSGIAWPLIMITTVVTGQCWSFFLGEWEGASSAARNWNKASFLSLMLGVVVIAVGSTV